MTAIEKNGKAWENVKEAAGRELRSVAPMQNDGDSSSQTPQNDSGVRYMYAEDVEQGAKESGIDIEKPIEKYPYDTKKVIEEYIVSTNEKLLEKAKKFRTVKNAEFERINLSHVSKKEAEDIKRLTGADVSGYRHAINSTTLIHIENRHGQNGKHDNTMSNLEDVARVEYVLENYDSVDVLKNEKGETVYSKEFRDSNNNPAPLLIFTKKINGTYYSAVAVAENSYKKMWVATTYISKNKEGITQELHDELSSLSTTPETNLASLPSNEIVAQNEAVVKEGELYSQGEKVSISDDARIVKNIVLDEESRAFRKRDAKGYKVIEIMAQDLGKKVKFVKGLTNGKGELLGGIITNEGVFINTEVENPTQWVATHEFSHRMKQTAGETWQRYQDYVIKKMKSDGTYEPAYELKRDKYSGEQIDEEIAADYIGKMFADVKSLAAFIRNSRRDAVTVRDIWYNILDKLGLLDEKKKAQLMWRDAYREAVRNKDKEYEGESKPAEKKSVTDSQRVVDLSENNELTERIKGLQGSKKYKAIRDFILETMKDYEIVFNDGINAIVDKSDALHIANKSANKKTSYISKIREVIENSKLYAVAKNVEHNKFSEFRYYKAVVKFGEEEYGIYLNVGKSKNGDGYHLYDITKKIGGIAKQNNALEWVYNDLHSEIDSSPNSNVPQNALGVKGKKSVIGTRLGEVEDTTQSNTDGKFIPPGVEPRRDVKVPQSVEEGTKVRQFARTAAEAKTLTDKTAEGVLEDVEKRSLMP